MTNYKNTEIAKAKSRNISSSTTKKMNEVFELFNKVFQNYSPDEVFVSFNGGKDCTVVLNLVHQYFKTREDLSECAIPVLYIQPKNPFQEVEDFVAQCEEVYQLHMIKRGGKIKATLEQICAERPNLKTVVMGVRRTDPEGRELKPLQQTDPGWPPLLRVNPILDWTTRDVWTYILENNIPYCSLYDMGYTSIGDMTNTKRNIHLKKEDPVTGEVTYLPAYTLLDDKLERNGRL